MAFQPQFDAAIGRYVLCFQPDPVQLLRVIASLVRPGGIILFHEPDRAQMRSSPPAPTYDQACQWVGETYRRAGVDVRMGIKLYSRSKRPGSRRPPCGCTRSLAAQTPWTRCTWMPIRPCVLAADMERLGVATASELGVDTLVERIVEEMTANQSVIVGRAEIGAWSRV